MSVLRDIVNRLNSLLVRPFLRLRHLGQAGYSADKTPQKGATYRAPLQDDRQTEAREPLQSSPLIESLRRFLLLDHVDKPSAYLEASSLRPNKYSRRKRRRHEASANRRSARQRNATKKATKSRRHSVWQIRPFVLGGSHQAWIIALLAVLILTACFGQRFYRQPSLDVRSVSPKDFYAPASAVVEDKKETEIKRDSIRNAAAHNVLKIDLERTAEAQQSLDTLLGQGQELRSQSGRPNFINLTTLSESAQDYLFQSSEAQWRKIWRLAKDNALSPDQVEAVQASETNLQAEDGGEADGIANDRFASSSSVDSSADSSTPDTAERGESEDGSTQSSKELPKELADQVRSLTAEQTSILRELLAYRELSGPQGLDRLQTRVDTSRKQYLRAYEDFVAAASTKDQPLYNSRLFELSEAEWATLERSAKRIFNEMMLQGITEGIPEDVMRRAIEARVADEPSKAVRDLTADVVAASVSPNLVIDQERTKQQAEQAVRQIDPVQVSVEKGELIVGADQVISSADFALLDHFGLTNRYFNWIGLSGFAALVSFAVAIYLWIDQRQTTPLNQRDHYLVMLLCLVVSVLAALKIPTVGLPAVGLLVGSFYGAVRGMTVIVLLTLILPIGTGLSYLLLTAGCVAAMLGAWIAPQLRSREEFALLGGFVGLTQAIVHLALTLTRFTVAAPLWKAVFVGSATYGLYGIAWSVMALGVSPYLEHFFDVVTPIRLAELANPNRPLLKRLAAEAPGTFQHTMFVANLAEAAARALSLNVELVRAGTLYHDIGKMHEPQGFIENQMGGPNMHDALDDPWTSASIIKKHVTQGLVMARQYRLPLAIQAFIPEHQGDMKISYFYQQAKARQEENPSLVVNPADFSYDGPIPQSPETGITMLADSCEAALRSLKPEASMDEAYAMVNKILRARWRSRQLMDSGLTREDMDTIASVFIQVWQQHNHKRIEYPKEALLEQGR